MELTAYDALLWMAVGFVAAIFLAVFFSED